MILLKNVLHDDKDDTKNELNSAKKSRTSNICDNLSNPIYAFKIILRWLNNLHKNGYKDLALINIKYIITSC